MFFPVLCFFFKGLFLSLPNNNVFDLEVPAAEGSGHEFNYPDTSLL